MQMLVERMAQQVFSLVFGALSTSRTVLQFAILRARREVLRPAQTTQAEFLVVQTIRGLRFPEDENARPD
tara:strand:- start:10298 stop:10507 length:210 start_codon:yes stop_codon:yes gene_type:complete